MRKTSYQRLSIVADPQLLAMGILAIFVAITLCLIVIIDAYISEQEQFIGLALIFSMIGLTAVVAGIICAPRWYTRITFLREGIYIKSAWKNPVERPYKYYQYIYKAWYWHGSMIGIGKTVEYMVFSHRRLKDEEVRSINQLAPTSDVIKIRYSPKSYVLLMEILPREMCYKLKACRFE